MNFWRLKRKIHSSWQIAIICAGIFIGVYVAQYFSASSLAYLVIAILLVAAAMWQKYIYLVPLLIIGGMLFGLWRGSLSQNELSQFKPFYGHNINISGSVKDDVDISSSNQLVIRLGDLTMKNKSMPGVLWVSATGPDIKRGDKLEISGKLMAGFGNFAGVIYRANIDKIIHPQPGDVARVVRDWFGDAVRRAIPDPEASLGIGYLTGQRRSLPPDLVLALQVVGLTHVVVASGYNLTILVRLARKLFVKVSKYLVVLSSGVMIVSFMAVTGVSPSMSRAGLVSALSLAAWYYGRKFHPIVLLLLAVAITVTINPSYAWGDLGWQLSFAAFAGVMILAPLSQRYFFGDKKPGFIGQALGETISAQIATAPIIILAFGQLSNVAIVSNLLVLPLVPYAMLLVFVAGVGSLTLPAFATIIAVPATWILQYMVGVINCLSSLPWAMSVVNVSAWAVAIYYVAIICICIYMSHVTKFRLREVNIIE